MPFLLPKGEYVAVRDESKFKGTCRIQVLRSSAEWSLGINREVGFTEIEKERLENYVSIKEPHYSFLSIVHIWNVYLKQSILFISRINFSVRLLL